MTALLPSNRLALFASLTGLLSFVCFGFFTLNAAWSRLIVGAPFASLVLGLLAIALGMLARRTNSPQQLIDRAYSWGGIICGGVMILAWLAIAVLSIGIILGEPM